MMIKKELELYVHIPFCVKKCAYCDFLSGPAGEKDRAAYVDALVREMESRGKEYEDYCVSTVFVGGGTPSILRGDETARIFHALRTQFCIHDEAEITMEVNPGTVTEKKAAIWKKCGINRLSIGLQSADDNELKLLGRIHTYEEFLGTWRMLREKGYHNMNVDLISAIPGQDSAGWERTLRTVAELEPEHISAYSLIVEEGTPFYDIYGEKAAGQNTFCGMPGLPDEDTEREIYKATARILKDYGYHRYEISNYAKGGRECRHNLGYWERKEYLGLGLGAASLIDECRFRNTTDMKAYLDRSGEDIREECERLAEKDQMEEYMFLGLRKTEGISCGDFQKKFRKSVEDVYGEPIRKFAEQGLLQCGDGRIRLTELGIDVSNYVFAGLML